MTTDTRALARELERIVREAIFTASNIRTIPTPLSETKLCEADALTLKNELCERTVASLKALSLTPTDTRGWEPIETAPKDGTDILGLFFEGGFCQVISYEETETGGDWVWTVMDGTTYHRDAFTHWQPLPTPPPHNPEEGAPHV